MMPGLLYAEPKVNDRSCDGETKLNRPGFAGGHGL
jgi:hypothetical protein